MSIIILERGVIYFYTGNENYYECFIIFILQMIKAY